MTGGRFLIEQNNELRRIRTSSACGLSSGFPVVEGRGAPRRVSERARKDTQGPDIWPCCFEKPTDQEELSCTCEELFEVQEQNMSDTCLCRVAIHHLSGTSPHKTPSSKRAFPDRESNPGHIFVRRARFPGPTAQISWGVRVPSPRAQGVRSTERCRLCLFRLAFQSPDGGILGVVSILRGLTQQGQS